MEIDSRWATGGLPSHTSRWSGQTGCMQGVVNLLQKWHSRQSPWQPGGTKIHTLLSPRMIQSGTYNYLLFLLFYQTCLLLNGLFPSISALCEEKLDCHYYVFQGTSSLSSCVVLQIAGSVHDCSDKSHWLYPYVFCSFYYLAEEAERVSQWGLGSYWCSFRFRPPTATYTNHLEQCREPGKPFAYY